MLSNKWELSTAFPSDMTGTCRANVRRCVNVPQIPVVSQYGRQALGIDANLDPAGRLVWVFPSGCALRGTEAAVATLCRVKGFVRLWRLRSSVFDGVKPVCSADSRQAQM